MESLFLNRSTQAEERFRSVKLLVMEIKDNRQIEIFHTLEKIERINKAIRFHLSADQDADKLAIEQYMQIKAQLTEQLLELLEQMGLHLQVTAA